MKKQCNICKKWKCSETEFQTSLKCTSKAGIEKRYTKGFCKDCGSVKYKKYNLKRKKEKLARNKGFAETKANRKWYAERNLFHIWKPSKNILIN